MNHPGEPVDLAEELEVKLAVLDEVVGVDDDEEPRGHVQVEGDVHHHNQHTSNLSKIFRQYTNTLYHDDEATDEQPIHLKTFQICFQK